MNTLELKSNFHMLIDNISNEKILSSFYEIMSSLNEHKEGSLWAKLSVEERLSKEFTRKEKKYTEELGAYKTAAEKKGKCFLIWTKNRRTKIV